MIYPVALALELLGGAYDTGQELDEADRVESQSNADRWKEGAFWKQRQMEGRDSTAVDYDMEGLDGMLLPRSEMGDVYAREYDTEAQEQALAELTRLSQDGLLSEDMERLGGLDASSDQVSRSQYGALANRLAATGAAGGAGGQRYMAGAQSQAMANSENQLYQQGVVDAQERAIQARRDRAGLASRMRAQEFEESRRRAEAMDRRDRSNAEYRRGVGSRNADRRNEMERSRTRDEREGLEQRSAWNDRTLDSERYYDNQRRANQASRDQLTSGTINRAAGTADGFFRLGLDDEDDDA